jgi:tetratricopeptide (TPR) repeat protein
LKTPGRFEICERAGRGGSGAVFRARDRERGDLVALKIVDDAGLANRVEREAAALAALDHPGIVGYRAHGLLAGGRPYLATDWIDGETLRARLRRGPLDAAEVIDLAGRVGGALAVAHRAGVVHRDVKPANIMLPGGEPAAAVLVDFGIAWVGAADGLPSQLDAGGTPGYMAPEQARIAARTGPSADVFALGCVLHHALAGRPPFAAAHAVAVLAKLLFEEPEPIVEIAAGAPAALTGLIERMMAKRADDRPADGAAVCRALERDEEPEPREVPGFDLDEQRFAFVLLAPAAPIEQGATLPTLPAGGLSRRAAEVDVALASYGARIEWLPDGSLVAVVTGSGPATDQGARAARCAAAVRDVTGRPVAVATGRVGPGSELGAAIDRVAAMAGASTAPGGAPEVEVDGVAARLLSDRFEVARRGGRAFLGGERARSGRRRGALIGRDRELAALLADLEACAGGGTPRAVVIAGPAGIGKSRLLEELAARAGDRASVLFARADPMTAGAPLQLLSQVVRQAAGVDPAAPAADSQRRLIELAARGGGDFTAAAFFGELAAVPFANGEVAALDQARRDPRSMADQLRLAWRRLARILGASGPQLIALEDLHWGDRASLSLLDDVLAAPETGPIFVAAAARPSLFEWAPEIWSERAARVEALEPLADADAVELARRRGAPARRLAEIAERADGNPFFIEELARAATTARSGALPETVMAMLDGRIGALAGEARRALRAASVFGDNFWVGGVAALCGDPPGLAALFDDLIDRHIVVPGAGSRVAGARELRFRHSLLREAAYAQLADNDRAACHARAGAWLESHQLDEPLTLATHYERGARPADAAGWFAQAAERALAANDLVAAIDAADRGVAAGAGGEMLGSLWAVRAQAHLWQSDFEAMAGAARRALDAFAPKSRRWYEVAHELAVAANFRGDSAGLVELASALLDPPDDPDAMIAYATAAARASGYAGRHGEPELSARLLERARAAGEPLADRSPRMTGVLANARAIEALLREDMVAFVEHESRAAACFGEAGELRWQCNARCNIGYALLKLGVLDRAAAELRETLAVATELDLVGVTPYIRSNLGGVCEALGELDEAIVYGTEAAAELRAQGDSRGECGARIQLAWNRARAGDLDGARAEIDDALDAAAAMPTVLPYALAVRARIAVRAGERERAVADAARAKELLAAGPVEMGDLVIRLAIAETERRFGDPEIAAAAIADAHRALTETATELEPKSRAGFLERIPDHARIVELAGSLQPAKPRSEKT